MGVALAAVNGDDLAGAGAALVATRPTAVNLAWGVGQALSATDPVAAARALAEADVSANRRLGSHGAALIDDGARVLTHCNAGSLACVGYGTALGVVRAAHEQGKHLHVWVDEPRPVLQGSRLTAWELDRLGVEFSIVPDSLAGALMRSGEVDAVVVGADRIAANGDVVNKVGTYALAVLARHHEVPFYVAAPTSTIDLATAAGDDVVIERRDAGELLELGGSPVAPVGASGENRAFDVTPHGLITAYITELAVSTTVPVSSRP
jgi:methylthioribose-1-phosphate isomerase